MREQRIVIAVLPPVLETPYARAVESLLARILVGIVEGLVLEDLKPIFPPDKAGLVCVLTEHRISGCIRRISAGLLLDRACGEWRRVGRIPWNDMDGSSLARERVR